MLRRVGSDPFAHRSRGFDAPATTAPAGRSRPLPRDAAESQLHRCPGRPVARLGARRPTHSPRRASSLPLLRSPPHHPPRLHVSGALDGTLRRGARGAELAIVSARLSALGSRPLHLLWIQPRAERDLPGSQSIQGAESREPPHPPSSRRDIAPSGRPDASIGAPGESWGTGTGTVVASWILDHGVAPAIRFPSPELSPCGP
jgi:hypothetical protein